MWLYDSGDLFITFVCIFELKCNRVNESVAIDEKIIETASRLNIRQIRILNLR